VSEPLNCRPVREISGTIYQFSPLLFPNAGCAQ
jgi:hypothetical protein